MQLTPAERDRLLLFSAAEVARSRRARGLRLNVPEATALIADTVAEAARYGRRLAEAIEVGRSTVTRGEALPGVPEVVTEVQVEAVFDDGTRLAVVTEPFGPAGEPAELTPGAILPGEQTRPSSYDEVVEMTVENSVSTGQRHLAFPLLRGQPAAALRSGPAPAVGAWRCPPGPPSGSIPAPRWWSGSCRSGGARVIIGRRRHRRLRTFLKEGRNVPPQSS